MRSTDFINLACQWAFEHDTMLVHDNEFLPSIRSMGVSDEEILHFKHDLQQRRALTNHGIVGEWADFDLSRSVFLQYVKKTIPQPVQRARVLYAHWKRSPSGGPFTSAYLAEKLGISERHAHYILALLIAE